MRSLERQSIGNQPTVQQPTYVICTEHVPSLWDQIHLDTGGIAETDERLWPSLPVVLANMHFDPLGQGKATMLGGPRQDISPWRIEPQACRDWRSCTDDR